MPVAATPSINRATLVAKCAYSGIDYLMLCHGVRCKPEVTRSVLLTEITTALDAARIRWGFGKLSEKGTSRSTIAKFRLELMDVLVQRVSRGFYRIKALVRTRHLHSDPRGTYLEARRVLMELAYRMYRTDLFTFQTQHPYLYAVHLFADVVGWSLTRAMVRRLVSMSRAEPDDYGKGGRVFTGITIPNVIRIYFKSFLVKRRPSTKFVEARWRTGGWMPGMDVWRVELMFGPERLRKLGVTDPNQLWQGGLTHTRLPARSKDPDAPTGSDRPEGRIWRLLRRLTLNPPWDAGIALPPTASAQSGVSRSQVHGTLLWALAESIDDPQLPEEDLDGEICGRIAALLAHEESRNLIMLHLRRR